MDTTIEINSTALKLERYPVTTDASLRAWSNAELLALDYIKDKKTTQIHLFNDRFGVWNCALQHQKITTIWTYASQQKAVLHNLKLNNISSDVDFKTPLDDLEKVDTVLLKIPKSLELFELFLQQIHKASHEKTTVVCGFMTKYFSASFLKIASRYFEDVSQSKAHKKARLLILESPKKITEHKELLQNINWKNDVLQQYYGVFSSGNIDIGTQFLLENLEVKSTEKTVLDVASGNGIIAFEIAKKQPEVTITLVDDFNLAIASSKINLKDKKAVFVCEDTLQNLPKETFDLVVSNPPFHFEHENNIEVTLLLFKGVYNCLHTNGRFLLVANSHLNYQTHLRTIFSDVEILKENKKFQILSCRK